QVLVSGSLARLLLHSFPTRRSSDLLLLVVRPELDQDVDRVEPGVLPEGPGNHVEGAGEGLDRELFPPADRRRVILQGDGQFDLRDRKSTRLNSSHVSISYAVFCLKK